MILAVDCGSTSFKAAVFDLRLKMKGEGAAALSHDYPAAGLVELEVEGAASAFGEAVAGGEAGDDAVHLFVADALFLVLAMAVHGLDPYKMMATINGSWAFKKI